MRHQGKQVSRPMWKRWIGVYIVCWAIGLGWMSHMVGHVASADVQGMNYTVHSGDTLWSIANNYLKDEDPRQAVDELEQANHLEDGPIYAGQKLWIPTSSRS